MISIDVTFIPVYWGVLLSLVLSLWRQWSAPPTAIRLGFPQPMRLPVAMTLLRQGARVAVPLKPLWYRKGWRKKSGTNEYTGVYTAAGRRWQGLIQRPYAGRYEAYIWQPPLAELELNTAHRACFSQNGEAGRYKIHFSYMPDSLDQAIESIEDVLEEAYRRRG